MICGNSPEREVLMSRNILKFIKKMFISSFARNSVKSFDDKLKKTIIRAEKAAEFISNSNLPGKDKLQIAEEIHCLINDILELQNIKLMEEQRIWEMNFYDNQYWDGLF